MLNWSAYLASIWSNRTTSTREGGSAAVLAVVGDGAAELPPENAEVARNAAATRLIRLSRLRRVITTPLEGCRESSPAARKSATPGRARWLRSAEVLIPH